MNEKDENMGVIEILEKRTKKEVRNGKIERREEVNGRPKEMEFR